MDYKVVEEKLKYLYGKKKGEETTRKLEQIIIEAKRNIVCDDRALWDEKDIALITYADSFEDSSAPTLNTLNRFLSEYIQDKFSIVHILPFAPFSSDRGFSVINYLEVKKEFGNWSDIEIITKKYRLMVDLVANHVSAQSKWFKEFGIGNSKYKDYFIWFDKENIPAPDVLSKVRRGRATSVLTPFSTNEGKKFLWTTYSVGNTSDQIDLNYKNPEVLLEIIKIYLFYFKKGVSFFRLDGIAGLWKELGTICKHLPQTHTIISLFRDILNEVCPSAVLISETTTATKEERLSYVSEDEANITYNFDLAPLILFSFYSGSVSYLSEIISNLNLASSKSTFFNILDIHDGLNVFSVSKILSDIDMRKIYDEIEKRSGTFSYRSLPDGGKAVKEMHITWWSALNKDDEEPFEMQLRKFITARAITMSIQGIPAIYYLSLFGSKNDLAAYKKTHHGRDINRTNLSYDYLRKKLSNIKSRESKIFNALMDLIEKRKVFKAFHPNARQKVISLDPRIFAVIRGEGYDCVLALHNVSNEKVTVEYLDKSYILEAYSFSWNKL